MNRRAAKELLHIEGWLERVDDIVAHDAGRYMAD